MLLSNPLAWVVSNSHGRVDSSYPDGYEDDPLFLSPLDSENFYDPTGGPEGQGVFNADYVQGDIWLSLAVGYFLQSFERGVESFGDLDGHWNLYAISDVAHPEYGSMNQTSNTGTNYGLSGELTAPIAAGLFAGPVLPGSFSFGNSWTYAVDDGLGNIEPASAASSVTGEGLIDYETGALSYSFIGTWLTGPSFAERCSMLVRPLKYMTGPSAGNDIPDQTDIPTSITIHWRRTNEPSDQPITVSFLAGVDGQFEDSDTIELPDSAGAESGSYDLEVPEGVQVFAIQLYGETGCFPETGIQFWFEGGTIQPAAVATTVLGVGLASTIQELLQD